VSVDHHDGIIGGTDKTMSRGGVIRPGSGRFPTDSWFPRGGHAWLFGRTLTLGNIPQTIRSNAFLQVRSLSSRQHLLKILPGRVEFLALEGLVPQANVFSHKTSSVQHDENRYSMLSAVARVATKLFPAPHWRGMYDTQY
jgi:hypothetical protein